MISPDLHDQVTAWIAHDPDERDRAELAALLRAAATESGGGGAGHAAAELADRFAKRLEFGTAGLRGQVAAGPNRMNRAVVRGTTAALAGWLRYVDPAAADDGVVIGCDARHRSQEFAAEAAVVLAGAGIPVHLLPARQPTPLLAFAVRHLRAAAGIMITASHNPPADNGYKLYLRDGAQIVPPADLEIEAATRALGPLSAVPTARPDDALIVRHSGEIAAAYLDAVCAASPAPRGAAWLRYIYTPLHGVAGDLAVRAFEQAGFPPPDVVEAQFDPDPDFRTVAFPNPEEPGALDLALAQARRSGADLVLANDPDGDRLAVAVPDDAVPGGWRTLTGDQVGALLGDYLLRRAGQEPDDRQPLAVTTIVSATLLDRIATATGAAYAETLTGFKWIARAGDLRPECRFAYGYEEALGYCVSDIVRDKDGIGAALAVLSLAALARSSGRSLPEIYDALEVAHGVHLTEQLTVATTAPVHVMSRLRAAPPHALAGQPITGMSDLTGGTADLPSADVLRYWLPGARLVIRPSGTEPKLKAYLEVVEPVIAGRLDEARRASRARLEPLSAAVRGLLGSLRQAGTQLPCPPWRAHPGHGKLGAMTSQPHDHDHAHGHDHDHPHGHDHAPGEHDAACEVAHGTVPAPASDRTLVAVFATPVAQYLLRYAADAGYRAVLVEPDAALATGAAWPGLDIYPAIGSVPDAGTDVVVTDHHREELGVMLRDALGTPARWVGIMGSPRAEPPHIEALALLGVEPGEVARVHRPIGLNIGSQTPPEIAIATLAGLLADRNERPGGFDFG